MTTLKSDSRESLVSVIIPAYQAERFIANALESVLKQAYPNWEAIVVDDGSKDGTANVVKSYTRKDKRIKYVFQENQRMAAARNKGISLARGKYIAFLDADDAFLPEKLKIQVHFMDKHPECGVCYAKIKHFYEDSPGVFYENPNERPIKGDAFRSFLWRNSINLLETLVRKDLFDRFGAFQEKWAACDEQYVWVNLAWHGTEFCFINEEVGIYREHKASDSHRNAHIFDTANCFLKMLDLIEPKLSSKEKQEYEKDFIMLRKRYRKMRLIGKLMKTPPFSWVLHPMYVSLRDNKFILIR